MFVAIWCSTPDGVRTRIFDKPGDRFSDEDVEDIVVQVFATRQDAKDWLECLED